MCSPHRCLCRATFPHVSRPPNCQPSLCCGYFSSLVARSHCWFMNPKPGVTVSSLALSSLLRLVLVLFPMIVAWREHTVALRPCSSLFGVRRRTQTGARGQRTCTPGLPNVVYIYAVNNCALSWIVGLSHPIHDNIMVVETSDNLMVTFLTLSDMGDLESAIHNFLCQIPAEVKFSLCFVIRGRSMVFE